MSLQSKNPKKFSHKLKTAVKRSFRKTEEKCGILWRKLCGTNHHQTPYRPAVKASSPSSEAQHNSHSVFSNFRNSPSNFHRSPFDISTTHPNNRPTKEPPHRPTTSRIPSPASASLSTRLPSRAPTSTRKLAVPTDRKHTALNRLPLSTPLTPPPPTSEPNTATKLSTPATVKLASTSRSLLVAKSSNPPSAQDVPSTTNPLRKRTAVSSEVDDIPSISSVTVPPLDETPSLTDSQKSHLTSTHFPSRRISGNTNSFKQHDFLQRHVRELTNVQTCSKTTFQPLEREGNHIFVSPSPKQHTHRPISVDIAPFSADNCVGTKPNGESHLKPKETERQGTMDNGHRLHLREQLNRKECTKESAEVVNDFSRREEDSASNDEFLGNNESLEELLYEEGNPISCHFDIDFDDDKTCEFQKLGLEELSPPASPRDEESQSSAQLREQSQSTLLQPPSLTHRSNKEQFFQTLPLGTTTHDWQQILRTEP